MSRNPCRTCVLCESDKNNPTCMKCSKRIAYVTGLNHDLCFAASRSGPDAAAPNFSAIARLAYFSPAGTDG